MEYSGQSNLKQVWLECGGKSPHIIFDDCPDLDHAAGRRAIGIQQPGRSRIAGSRLYVQAGIYDTFVSKVEACARDAARQSARPRLADGRHGR